MTTAHEFKIQGSGSLPQDNGYLILSALSRKFPFLHGNRNIQIAPVRGTWTETNQIRLDAHSILHIRGLTEEQAREISGSWVICQGAPLLIGQVVARDLRASSYLACRMVVLEGIIDPEPFRAAVQAKVPAGTSVTLGRRQCFRFKGQRQIGYAVHLGNLTAEGSVQVMAKGLGKHTTMGCGVFYPGHGATRLRAPA